MRHHHRLARPQAPIEVTRGPLVELVQVQTAATMQLVSGRNAGNGRSGATGPFAAEDPTCPLDGLGAEGPGLLLGDGDQEPPSAL